MGPWVFGFVGMAMLYAGTVVMAMLLAAWLAGRFPGWRVVPFMFTTLAFVFLTQHPFPVPDQVNCPVPTAQPQLHLFQFWATFARLYDQGAGVAEWLLNRTVIATTANFIVCTVIGVTLACHTSRLRVALCFGAGLTLGVELTQLSGLWGFYACAYRQFNVDDLMLNVIGIVVGFLLARWL